ADPEVKLFYNDYNTFQPSKTQAIYRLVSHLKEKGLIDGIGMQGYMDLSYPGIESGRDNLKDALAKFAELGLEIHITELSIRTNGSSEELFRRQAQRYQAVFNTLAEMDTAGGGPANITSVTVFGLMDNYLFYSDDTTTTRLFDGNLQPKPAFYSVLGVAERLNAQVD
ncbi:MAG: endo-1,4-beta-xylanase, partial [Bacillota bacterium]